MPGITIHDFKSNVEDIIRPNRFLLSFENVPTGVPGFTEDMQYHVKSASIPSRTIGEITTLNWFGHQDKRSGDITYEPYTVIFWNNINLELRTLMEQWVNLIADPITNTRRPASEYRAIIKLEQIGNSSKDPIMTYYLHDAWPKSLDTVELSHETVDQVQEFSVSFTFNYFSSDVDPTVGSGIGLVHSNKK